MKPIYTAPTAAAARDRYEEFAQKWGTPYPAIKTLWDNAWEEFIAFLDYDVAIRKVICSTNAIESLSARHRRAVRASGHVPNEQAAMKTFYLVTRSLDSKGTGQTRRVTRRKPALNAFTITFSDPRARGGGPLTVQSPLTPLTGQSHDVPRWPESGSCWSTRRKSGATVRTSKVGVRERHVVSWHAVPRDHVRVSQ